MKSRHAIAAAIGLGLSLLIATAPAVGDDPGRDDQTVGVTVRTPGLLAIDVDAEVALGVIVPGTSTSRVGFHVGIVNDTDGAWEVHVVASDFESFAWECDDDGQGCVRTLTDPVHRIDASNLHIRGGIGSDPVSASMMASHEGHLGIAGTPFLLLTGSSAAAGTFDVDDPQTTMWLDVPASVPDGEYSATLTYTIMGATQ